MLHREMAGFFFCLLLVACQENMPSPPASNSEPNRLQAGHSTTAERVLVQALCEAETSGQDHDLAAALHDVGARYRIQRNWAAAEPYFWRVLQV